MRSDKRRPEGNYLEDFKVGHIYRHFPGKTITEAECHLFSLITMNHHPLHIDATFAEASQHGKILVPGTLVLSLAVGQSVRDISLTAIANLCFDHISHQAPVFIGDTLRSASIIRGVRDCKKPDRGIIVVKTVTHNQDETQVLEFVREVLIPKRGVPDESADSGR